MFLHSIGASMSCCTQNQCARGFCAQQEFTLFNNLWGFKCVNKQNMKKYHLPYLKKHYIKNLIVMRSMNWIFKYFPKVIDKNKIGKIVESGAKIGIIDEMKVKNSLVLLLLYLYCYAVSLKAIWHEIPTYLKIVSRQFYGGSNYIPINFNWKNWKIGTGSVILSYVRVYQGICSDDCMPKFPGVLPSVYAVIKVLFLPFTILYKNFSLGRYTCKNSCHDIKLKCTRYIYGKTTFFAL